MIESLMRKSSGKRNIKNEMCGRNKMRYSGRGKLWRENEEGWEGKEARGNKKLKKKKKKKQKMGEIENKERNVK